MCVCVCVCVCMCVCVHGLLPQFLGLLDLSGISPLSQNSPAYWLAENTVGGTEQTQLQARQRRTSSGIAQLERKKTFFLKFFSSIGQGKDEGNWHWNGRKRIEKYLYFAVP